MLWLQGYFEWQDGSVLSHQNWFYPEQHMNYFNMRTYGLDMNNKSNTNMLALLPHYHKYIQPQIREDFDCSALIAAGHSMWDRKWVTINCSMAYEDVAVICEPSTETNIPVLGFKYINIKYYNSLVNAKMVNNTLLIPEEHCTSGWLHYDGACVQFYAGNNNHTHECGYLDREQVNTELQTSLSPVARIHQQFVEQSNERDTPVFVAKCIEATITKNLSLQEAFYQCADGTLIIQHHMCDSEADCPHGSDEANCSWVCNFEEHHNCFSDCVKPNCTCHQLYFNCESGGCVPLSRFCDGIIDCPDASDEALCLNNISEGTPAEKQELFTCQSGDIISKNRLNDTIPDCPFHGDDEAWLSKDNIIVIDQAMPLVLQCIPGHPKLYKHHQLCLLTWQEIDELATCRNGGHLSDCVYHSCPQHYKCEYSYCIPLHAVCDGVWDCPRGEDEQNCVALSCPNNLKCKQDNVCVHRNNINNGAIDCPAYKDDEVTLTMAPCPPYCQCIGHAALCTGDHPFTKSLAFIRSLRCCNSSSITLTNKTFLTFDALRFLDLSNNRLHFSFKSPFDTMEFLAVLIVNNASISAIRAFIFKGLQNVRDLQLQYNPIRSLHTDGFNGLPALPVLDLSRLTIRKVFPCSFRGLHSLVHLDLSYNKISTLSSNTFCGLGTLQVLYLQHNPITFVDEQVFIPTKQLQELVSSMTGLCCYANTQHCTPQFDDNFASCTSILHHGIIRYTIYIIAVVPVVLNTIGFTMVQIFFVEKSVRKEVNNKFRKQLLISDATMGLFFLALSIYNIAYTGDFVTVGHLWKQSIHCRILSFVSMLSLEMTLSMVLILGMERFLAVCFPMKNIKISMKAAWTMIISAWLTAIALSITPLLNLYWKNSGLNNAMCITILSFDLLDLWIVATIYTVNTIVTIITLVLHVGVVRAVRNTPQFQHLSNARRNRERSVTIRIVSLIITNSTCWLVLGSVSLIHMIGLPMNNTVFAGVVTIVLPLSSLLNPVLNVFTTSEFTDTVKLKCTKL